MSCTFCIVALPVVTGQDNPGALVESALTSGGVVLSRALDTDRVRLWRGTSATGGPTVAVTLTLYKGARRLRVQTI